MRIGKTPVGGSAAVVLVLILLHGPAWAQKSPWEGAWRSKNPQQSLTVTLSAVTAQGFAMAFDEGTGMNGLSGEGAGRFSGPSAATAALKTSLGDNCAATLKLAGAELTVSGCTLGNELEGDTFVFVSAASPKFFQAGFDCAKAGTVLEKLICGSRALAALDKALAETYGALRKKLSAADQETLRAEQRAWLAGRDKACAAAADETGQARCLKRHYGSRLFAVRAWEQLGLHLTGEPAFANVSAAAKAALLVANGRRGADLLGLGLGPWLNGHVSHSLLETDYVEDFKTSVGAEEVVQTALLNPDPTQGFDPQGRDRRVIVVAHATQGLWFGDTYAGARLYAPPGKSLKDAPPALKPWLAALPAAEGRPQVQLVNALP
jgi:uncharacterized protein YecT (DUF1311 family)